MGASAVRLPLDPDAVSYAWRQLAFRAGLEPGGAGGTGFEELPVEVHYGAPRDAGTGGPGITVVPCRDSAWRDLLEAAPGALKWLPPGRVLPCGAEHPQGEAIPVLLWGEGFEGGEKPFAERRPDGSVVFFADIVAAAFFMLSRWEEAGSAERDEHGRFPGRASVAHRQGFLDRPVIDEYAAVLRFWLKEMLPSWSPGERRGRVFVTCDVDRPCDPSLGTPARAMKRVAGDLLKRRSAGMAASSVRQFIARSRGDWSLDPYNTFDWIMDVNERAGNRVAFYFLSGGTDAAMDGCYGLYEPYIRALMRRIHDRGHEIGLHGSYASCLDGRRYAGELDALRTAMEELGIRQPEIGSRQHYLRWSTPETARNLDKAGVAYDTTLGYADRPGFRCGTCFPYPMYDLIDRKTLRLRQYPLVLMEGTVVDGGYLGMGYSERALDLMLRLKERALRSGGVFTLVWHNCSFGCDAARSMYRELVT